MTRFSPILAALLLLPAPAAAGDILEGLRSARGLAGLIPAVAVPVSAPKSAEKAASPELSYESLVLAPVWSGSGAAAASDLSAGFLKARHQGRRNLCAAFSASALGEYLVWKKTGEKNYLSPEFSYYNAKLSYTDRPELQVYKSENGLAGYVAVLALAGGAVPEAAWPFKSSLPPHAPVPPITDPDAGTPPSGVFGKVLPHAFAPQAVRRGDIRRFLAAEGRPVAVNMMIYMDNADAATGRIADPTPEQKRLCLETDKGNCYGHVVLFTGYDPASDEYLFRNSWGENWGRAGYGRLSARYLAENCESCHYLSRLASFKEGDRSMVVNSSYGWSAVLR